MFETSELTEKLDELMAKAQAEFNVAAHDSKNPHFKNTYASLTAVWAAVRPALSKFEITVSQFPLDSAEPNRLRLMTRIAHKGEWIRCVSSLPVTKADAQGWGATLSYAKRYALMAILGLADDDDDGETASGRGKSIEKKLKDILAETKEDAKQPFIDAISKMLKEHADNLPPAVDASVRAAMDNAADWKELKRIADKLRTIIESQKKEE